MTNSVECLLFKHYIEESKAHSFCPLNESRKFGCFSRGARIKWRPCSCVGGTSSAPKLNSGPPSREHLARSAFWASKYRDRPGMIELAGRNGRKAEWGSGFRPRGAE